MSTRPTIDLTEAERWRLLLGEAAEQSLGAAGRPGALSPRP